MGSKVQGSRTLEPNANPFIVREETRNLLPECQVEFSGTEKQLKGKREKQCDPPPGLSVACLKLLVMDVLGQGRGDSN